MTPGQLVRSARLSAATVNKALRELERMGVLREGTAKKRNRLYYYDRYMAIIEADK